MIFAGITYHINGFAVSVEVGVGISRFLVSFFKELKGDHTDSYKNQNDTVGCK